MSQYSLEDYRRAFERTIGFIMGNNGISAVSDDFRNRVEGALRELDGITYEIKTWKMMQHVIQSLEYAQLEFEALEQDESMFLIRLRRIYENLLYAISDRFDEFNINHIAEVLGISPRDVEELWVEGFASANEIALEYYRTMKFVAESLEEITKWARSIRSSFDATGEDEEPQEAAQLKNELRALVELLYAAGELADEFDNEARECAINTLLFFLEEIERRIVSEA